MKIIGPFLKDIRKRHHQTQQWVADRIKVSRVYYSDIERGRYTPSLKVLVKLAILFDFDLNFLKQNVGKTQH